MAAEGRGGRASRLVEGVRRVVDAAVAALALVLLSPVLVWAVLAVRSQMGGPALFRQERAGRDGEPFVLLKLRTMTAPDALAPGSHADPDDDHRRLTPLGRRLRATSIDELPTLVNVLRGEMALVGPRPLPVRYLDRYTPRERRRLEVRPGVTGWAQVNGRNHITWDRRLDLDVWYVEHRSVGLDLRILWRTLTTVFRRQGVSNDAHATMPELRRPAS